MKCIEKWSWVRLELSFNCIIVMTANFLLLLRRMTGQSERIDLNWTQCTTANCNRYVPNVRNEMGREAENKNLSQHDGSITEKVTYLGVGDHMFGQFNDGKVALANGLLQLIVSNTHQTVDQRAVTCSGCRMWRRLKSHGLRIAQSKRSLPGGHPPLFFLSIPDIRLRLVRGQRAGAKRLRERFATTRTRPGPGNSWRDAPGGEANPTTTTAIPDQPLPHRDRRFRCDWQRAASLRTDGEVRDRVFGAVSTGAGGRAAIGCGGRGNGTTGGNNNNRPTRGSPRRLELLNN